MPENPRQTGVKVYAVRPIDKPNADPKVWIGHAATHEDACKLAMMHSEKWSTYRTFVSTDWDADSVIVDAAEVAATTT